MSFLSKLFGGGAKPAAPAKSIDYKGHRITATPFQEKERWQVCGVIAREVDGAMQEEQFIRADSSPSLDDATEMTFFKARQMIDLRGERVGSSE